MTPNEEIIRLCDEVSAYFDTRETASDLCKRLDLQYDSRSIAIPLVARIRELASQPLEKSLIEQCYEAAGKLSVTNPPYVDFCIIADGQRTYGNDLPELLRRLTAELAVRNSPRAKALAALKRLDESDRVTSEDIAAVRAYIEGTKE